MQFVSNVVFAWFVLQEQVDTVLAGTMLPALQPHACLLKYLITLSGPRTPSSCCNLGCCTGTSEACTSLHLNSHAQDQVHSIHSRRAILVQT